MAKKNLSELEQGAGYYLGLVSNLMGVVREKGVPFAAIYRLATDSGRKTLGKIVELAHADWLSEHTGIVVRPTVELQPQDGHPYRDAPTKGEALPPDHYRDRLTYEPLPSMEELKKGWGEQNVSPIFDGRAFTLHASCVGMDRTPGERIFYLHDAGRDWKSEEQIAWGLKQRNTAAPNGYRPATHEETYEFAKAHPELVDFVGLGSFAMDGGFRCVARAWRHGSQRILDHHWLALEWKRSSRVLFVRK